MKSVNKICAFIREQGKRDEQPNRNGNTIYRLFMPDERYMVDFADDFTAEGWLQFDTDQDAAYYGVWVNPRTRTSLCYAEGDWILVDCPTAENYVAEIQAAINFHGEGRIALVIDQRGNAVEYRQDRSKFLVVEGGAT